MNKMDDVRLHSVLLIEDTFTKEIDLLGQLEAAGFMVESTNKEDPYSAVERLRPAAIIIDIVDKNNVNEVSIIEILENEELATTEVFVYTKSIDVSLEVRMRKMGLKNYLIKNRKNIDSLTRQLNSFFEGWNDETPVILKELEAIREEEKAMHEQESNTLLDPIDDIISTMEDFYNSENEETSESIKEAKELILINNFEGAITCLCGLGESSAYKQQAMLLTGICHKRLGRYKLAIPVLQTGARNAKSEHEKLIFRYEIGVALDLLKKPKEAYRFLSAVYCKNKHYKDTTKRLLRLHKKIYPKGKL